MKRKIFILNNFGQRLTMILWQTFLVQQLSHNNFYQLLVNIECFYHLPKLKAKLPCFSICFYHFE